MSPLLDVWIVVESDDWAAITPQEGDPYETWHSAYRSAVTGYWAQSVYNVVGVISEIGALIRALGNPVAYAWEQGTGIDSQEVWPTDPSEILLLMKEHSVVDEEGEVTGVTPATIDHPNWGHVFLGQANRRFAGSFSNGFSGGFQ